jgi:L-threonylcarbamoyladenylate synthase
MAEIIPADEPGVVELAVQALQAGELVVFPTDTVYGLGAAAGNDAAVRKMFAAKGRPPSKAVPLLIADTMMAAWVADVPPAAQALIGAFWPGALTIVMRKHERFHSLALGGEDTVALRVPDHSLVRSIVSALGEPVTGTSANRAGARSPVSAAEAAMGIGHMVAFVIDGGPVRQRVESTIIDLTQEGGPKVLREGAISRDELKWVLGKPVA